MKNNRGTSPNFYLILVVGFLFILAGVAPFLMLRWVDQQEIPLASDARNTLRFVANVYMRIPGECGEKCVTRTITLAHLVALSQYGKKAPAKLAQDLGTGYSLINMALISGAPNKTAEFELALERLLFFNRMDALAENWGRSLDGGDNFEKVTSLEKYASDDETKSVSQREKKLFRILQRNKFNLPISHSDIQSEHTSFPDAYQLLTTGYALCAMGDEQGAAYIKQVSTFFSGRRNEFVYATARNLDAPLMAAAENQISCRKYIYELKNILGD